jgi:hypothetical protein
MQDIVKRVLLMMKVDVADGHVLDQHGCLVARSA